MGLLCITSLPSLNGSRCDRGSIQEPRGPHECAEALDCRLTGRRNIKHINYIHWSKVSPEHTTPSSWEHVSLWCSILGQCARWVSFPTQWNSSCQISSCLFPKWVPLKIPTAWPHSNSLHITEAVLKSVCDKQTIAQVSSCFTCRCPEQAVSRPVRDSPEKPGKEKNKKNQTRYPASRVDYTDLI